MLTAAALDFGIDDVDVPSWFLPALWSAVITSGWFIYLPDIRRLWRRLTRRKQTLEDLLSAETEREAEREWEILSHYGDTEDVNLFQDAARNLFRRRFPHTVRNKKTGKIIVIPHPSGKRRK